MQFSQDIEEGQLVRFVAEKIIAVDEVNQTINIFVCVKTKRVTTALMITSTKNKSFQFKTHHFRVIAFHKYYIDILLVWWFFSDEKKNLKKVRHNDNDNEVEYQNQYGRYNMVWKTIGLAIANILALKNIFLKIEEDDFA